MSPIAVVTDSTADLPDDLATHAGLDVVPLTVAFGDDTYVSGRTISTEQFYDRLVASDVVPTTAQPTPDAFADAYARLAAGGADAIVSVHCSSVLSGTVDSARVAAGRTDVTVRVVDTRLVGAALGQAALAAGRRAAAGADVEQIVAAAERVRTHGVGLLVVDTLEYLRRGGRLSGPQAALGTALRVKPLLHIVDGRVEVRERTRTWSRALARAVEIVEGVAVGSAVDVAIVHAVGAGRATELGELLAERVQVRERWDALIGPIVGAHVGPGAVGIAAVPAD